MEKLLGIDPARWWMPLSRAFLPTLASSLLVGCLFLVPLLFKGYIKDWGMFLKVLSIGFVLGAALAGIIWRKFMS